MSPRNSPEAVCQMLQKTGCSKVIVDPSLSALTSAVQTLMQERDTPLELVQLPSLHALYPSLGPGIESDDVPKYPSPDYPPRPTDVALILHSSGSTGFPNPIRQTQKTMLEWCSASQ